MTKNARIVLVEPTHPGNIGSVARAMKTMGFYELVLVAPKVFPAEEANALASGAVDILESARVVSTFEEAVKNCIFVVGASARSRAIPWPTSTPSVLASEIIKKAIEGPVALVFGRESSGLSNEELSKCHHHLYIPTNPEYGSLNLAQAVQIVVYECRLAALEMTSTLNVSENTEPLALHQDLEIFYNALEDMARKSGFLNPAQPRHLMTRLRRLFAKNPLTTQELNMLRGLFLALFEHRP